MFGSAPFDVQTPERLAKTMALLGRLVVVTAVVATIAALIIVQRLSVTYRDGLAVTEASASLVTDSGVPIRALADDLTSLAATIVDGLELAQSVVDTTESVIDEAGGAAQTNLADTANAAADVADRLAGTLETIERFIPGNSDSIAEELRAFSDGLEPVATQLSTIGTELSTLATELGDSQATLAELAVQIDVIAADIEGLGPSLGALDATAQDLTTRAAAASDRIGLDLWLARILIVAIGVVFAAIGVIAERFGRGLVASDPDSAAAQ